MWHLPRVLWLVASAALITFGFLVDGSSEIGHHAGFILGGVVCGAGVAKR